MESVEKYRKLVIEESTGVVVSENVTEMPNNLFLNIRSTFIIKQPKCKILSLRLAGAFDLLCLEYLHINSLILYKKDSKLSFSLPSQSDFSNLFGKGPKTTRQYLKGLTNKKALIKLRMNKYMVNPVYAIKGRFIPIDEAVQLYHHDQGFVRMISRDHHTQLKYYMAKNKIYMDPRG